MRLVELKPSQAKDILKQDADTIENWLTDKGYLFLGKGGFAKVFRHPDSKIAVKFNTRPDPCYIKFAAYAHKNRNNPHLPKMSPIREIDHQRFIVFMEELEPITKFFKKNWVTDLLNFIESVKEIRFKDDVSIYFENYYKKMSEDPHRWGLVWHQHFRGYNWIDKDHLFGLFETAWNILNLSEKCSPDFHAGNFMYRPSTKTIVFTDPIFTFDYHAKS